jgi:hypothetical protein
MIKILTKDTTVLITVVFTATNVYILTSTYLAKVYPVYSKYLLLYIPTALSFFRKNSQQPEDLYTLPTYVHMSQKQTSRDPLIMEHF